MANYVIKSTKTDKALPLYGHAVHCVYLTPGDKVFMGDRSAYVGSAGMTYTGEHYTLKSEVKQTALTPWKIHFKN